MQVLMWPAGGVPAVVTDKRLNRDVLIDVLAAFKGVWASTAHIVKTNWEKPAMKKMIFFLGMLYSVLAFAGPVNINSADAKTLAAELEGVGPVTAERIVAYRQEHGAFTAPEQLKAVRGVGEKTYAKNADNILLK
jgi:competence protein ComEA